MQPKVMPTALVTMLLLLLLFLVSGVSGAEEEDAKEEGTTELLNLDIFNQAVTENPTTVTRSALSDEEVAKEWQANFEKLRDVAKSLIKGALPFLMSSSSNIDVVSPSCRKAAFRFLLALQKFEPWALYMLDASAKSLNGILTGTLTALGSYDQCVDTVAVEKKRNSTKELFQGQYCSIKLRPLLPKKPRFYTLGKRMEAFKMFENDTGIMGEVTKHAQLFYNLPFRMGICIPSSCTAEDIHGIMKLLLLKFFDYEILVPSCEVKEPFTVDNSQMAVLVVFSLLMAVVLCGTCTELTLLYMKHRGKKTIRTDSTGMKCILAFSAYNNFMMLLDTDTASDKLKVLHGIRVYTMSWIVLGHTFYYINFSMIKQLRTTIQISQQMSFAVISNASYLVDNFFFISGLLMTYVTLNILQKTGKNLNIFHFIIHRIWRFLPIQMAFVGIVLLFPWMGSGPMWHETIDPIVDGCRKEWWTNLLFINNVYRNTSKGCVSHSWYLAADLQLYIFSLVVLIPLLRKPRLGLFINFFLIVAQILFSGLYTYLKDIPPAVPFAYADEGYRKQVLMDTHYAPHPHLGPFCIGIFIGYCMQRYPPPKKIHSAIQALAWIATLVVSSSVLFGLYEWNNGNDPGKFASIIYAALSRVSWTLTLAWITYACSSGYGGVLYRILSWKPLIPLSRLTFLMYMTHPLMQQVFYANIREGFQAKNFAGVFFFFSIVFSGYGLAAILCLFLESPFINLGKLIFQSRQAKEGTSSASTSKREPCPDKLSLGVLDCVSFEPPITNLNHHSSNAELVASPWKNNTSAGKVFENGDVIYRL